MHFKFYYVLFQNSFSDSRMEHFQFLIRFSVSRRFIELEKLYIMFIDGECKIIYLLNTFKLELPEKHTPGSVHRDIAAYPDPLGVNSLQNFEGRPCCGASGALQP